MILSMVVILLLVLLNGVFAMGELALISARRARLAVLVRRGVPGAERAKLLADDPQSFLPTVQVGITLVSILEGTFGGASIAADLAPKLARIPALAPFAHELALTLCVIVITSLMLVLGELVPKQLALRHPELIAARLSLPLLLLSRAAGPVVWLLGRSSSLVLRLIGVTAMGRQTVTEEELKALIAEGAQAGVLEIEERNMIERLLRLADRPVRAIMTPRNELVWIERRADPETLRAFIKSSGHTRVVVCDGDIDNPVGLIRAKDVLDLLLDGGKLTIEAVMLPPVVVPDTINAFDVLEQLRSHPLGMVLVLDEYGSFEGVVTAADVFEAIVGEQQEAGTTPQSHTVTHGVLTLDGASPADEIKDRLGLVDLPAEGSYHTLGGLILALLRRVPALGDKIAFSGWLFEVLEMDGRRVHKVRASRQALAEN
ncbi:HlyC/CorC family transporter [Lichenicola cladoniae]|uniref:HlyC/CorC family transporter n=1 Tax=Lichenicola cladoniae TaxID=1484109 RepID=A0A6M8HRP8_9PROT|nr:hemolysin family protein [Lichenicola cladoniae]NPD65854.1 HlyC/CorC family transporter [Acetobacteraceae bacterium]QKE91144.1 HlyC/CorC family transporter [Lichenicola cladoniae]